MQAIKAKITFEDVVPDNLIDVVRSITGSDGQSFVAAAPGVGVDELLDWSLHEVQLAASATNDSDRNRHATNALMSGRRALACLVEWYLERDYFLLCNDAPKGAEKKTELLLNRGLIDDLTSRVFPRTVQERDKVEHQFLAPTLEQAENFVQLMRRTIHSLRVESDPSYRRFLFGGISYRLTTHSTGYSAEFMGWIAPCFVICSFDARPWMGAIIPEPSDPAVAIVRRTFFDETPTKLLLNVLQILEQNFGPTKMTMQRELARFILAECGLINTVPFVNLRVLRG